LAKGKLGQQIYDAIASRDALSLRRMAAVADREESRMWLALLARMLELDASRGCRQQMGLRGLVVLPPTRRARLRRAG